MRLEIRFSDDFRVHWRPVLLILGMREDKCCSAGDRSAIAMAGELAKAAMAKGFRATLWTRHRYRDRERENENLPIPRL